MSFVHQIMTEPGTEPNRDAEAPSPPKTTPPSRRPPPNAEDEDADFGEEFGHGEKKGGGAGGEGFRGDQYDKVV